jgi:outer membrane lipoprotein carrier protein
MRPTSLFLAALLSFASLTAVSHAEQPAAPAAPAQNVTQAVNAVQQFYDKTTSFKADFSQEFYVKAYNQKKSSKGKVTFAKPGKMEWTYSDPKDNRVVSDGATLKVYEAANKQMYEQPVDKSQYPVALSFLTGQGKLSNDFNFELVPGDKMSFPGGYVLVGTPKVAHPAYTKVFFYVDSATSQIRRVMVLDGQSNRNRFDFESPRVNDPVNPAQFKFTPPPGTSVIRP